jgi:hypothetical protein
VADHLDPKVVVDHLVLSAQHLGVADHQALAAHHQLAQALPHLLAAHHQLAQALLHLRAEHHHLAQALLNLLAEHLVEHYRYYLRDFVAPTLD